MEPAPKVTPQPSPDVPHEEDVNHGDGDFDNESLSDGDEEFYTNGRLDFHKLFPNTDDNPIEFVYEYDKTGFCYSVNTRKKKDFVAKPVAVDDEGTSCIRSISANNEPTHVSNHVVINHNVYCQFRK